MQAVSNCVASKPMKRPNETDAEYACRLFIEQPPPPHRPRKRKKLAPEVRMARLRKRKRRYRQENKDLIAEHARRRAAAVKRATPPWADLAAIQAVYDQAAELSRTTGIRHEVDHIVPLRARNVSGLHVHYNLRAIPATDNRRGPGEYTGELCF